MTNQRAVSTVITFAHGTLTRRSLTWSVHGVSYTHTITVNKTPYRNRKAPTHDTLNQQFMEREGSGKSFLIYRREILRLIATEKSAHDALIIDLPCLMGFRSEEVTTWRLEWIDEKNEDCMVFDAKKHVLFPVPLHQVVEGHVEEVRDGRDEGLVIRNESTAWKSWEGPISTTAVWYTWRKWAKRLKLFPSPEAYSPIVGRRFFVKEFLRACRDDPVEGLISCSKIVRHSDVRITLEYAERIMFYEDVKRNFDKFQANVAEGLVEVETR